MTDLLQRLRSFTSGPHAGIAQEAADELESLRQIVDDHLEQREVNRAELLRNRLVIGELRDDIHIWMGKVADLQAENESLRAATDAAVQQIGRMREALRGIAFYSIDRGFSYRCRVCGSRWHGTELESHATDCLAAPKVET